jgi:hypothetical protein
MNNLIRLCILGATLLYSAIASSQPAFTASVFNESTSVPFTRFITTPVHPGVQLGAEMPWRDGRRFAVSPALNIGYMFHNKLFQGLYVNLEMAVDVKTGFGLRMKSKLGLGYLHTFTTGQEFQHTDGGWESRRDRGNARLMPSLSLGLGYGLNSSSPGSTEVFVMYRSWLEYPYSPGFIPLMAHTDLSLGVKFHPFNPIVK